jgi:hypothetical protein
MYTCYCSVCNSKEFTTAKTLRIHLEKDEEIFRRSDIPGHLRIHLQSCIKRTRQSLILNIQVRSSDTVTQGLANYYFNVIPWDLIIILDAPLPEAETEESGDERDIYEPDSLQELGQFPFFNLLRG